MPNKIEIDLSLEDKKGTIKKRTQDTKELNKELDKSQKFATGTQTGARAVTGARPMAQQVTEYGAGRGVAGMTGAGARDFANQAQGLGGLVRLYATWAANVYAVSAAFTALKNAADTTNMIEGMNQLGVSSGQALGSTAKRFVDATGGAISLKEAMSATVKATSAGLSTKQLQDIGIVATKTSRALGIDLNDAVNRLTRGITKLEPELLDELGIYTKIGPATEEYARKVGKTASTLTDFEKRQAFANAVLKEGADKFSAINVDANPYDKLVASLKNLQQTALELINKVLGPLINFLSQSPAALIGTVTALGSLLLRQVIPAVGQYRKELDDSFNRSAQTAKQKAEEYKQIEKRKYADVLKMSEANADAELVKYEKTLDNLEKARKFQLSKEAQGILGKTSVADISKGDISRLFEISKEKEAKGQTKAAEKYYEAAVALQKWTEAEKEHLRILKMVEQQIMKDKSAQKVIKESQTATAVATRRGIISKAAETVETGGIRAGLGQLFQKTKESDLSPFQKNLTRVTGTVTLLGTGLLGLVSQFGMIAASIGIVVTAFETLYSWFSKNREESQKLSQSLDQSNDTFKIAQQTFEKYKFTTSLSGVQAISNALGELANNVQNVSEKYIAFEKKSGAIDKAWQGIKSIVGFDEKSQVSKDLSKNLQAIFKNLDTTEAKTSFKTSIESVLNIAELDWNKLDKEIKKGSIKTLEQLIEVSKKVEEQQRANSAQVTALRDSYKAADTAFQNLNNSLLQTDPISNYAKELTNVAENSLQIAKNPTKAFAALKEALDDLSSTAQRFGVAGANALLPLKDEVNTFIQQQEQAKKRVEELSNEIEQLGKRRITEKFTKGQKEQEIASRKELKSTIETKLTIDAQDLQQKAQAAFKEAAIKGLELAFDIATKKAQFAGARSQIEVQKTIASFLPQSIQAIEIQADLDKQMINLRIQEIKSINELVKQLELDRLSREIESIEKKQQDKNIDRREYGVLERQRFAAKELYENIQTGKIARLSKAEFSALSPELKTSALKSGQREQGVQAQIIELAGQLQSIDIQKFVKTATQKFDDSTRVLTQELELRQREFDERKSLIGDSILLAQAEQDFQDQTANLRQLIATAEQRKALALLSVIQAAPGVGPKIVAGAEGLRPRAQQELKDKERSSELERETADNQRKRLIAEQNISREAALQISFLDSNNKLTDLNFQSKLQNLEQEKSILEVNIQNANFITQAEANRLREIDLQVLSQQRQQALDAETVRSKRTILDLESRIAVAKLAGSPTAGDLSRLEAERAAENKFNEQSIANINQRYDGLTKVRELQKDEGTRIKAYSDLFESTFMKMGDAIAEFAKTGKLDFKGLVNSMLEDILRLELKLQAQEMWKALRGSSSEGTGILGFLGNFLGIGGSSGLKTGTTSGGTPLQGSFDISSGVLAAKGGVFPTMEKFAKGGAFTNSIVNQPTLFKFARGTGLMGEAGPEAIMPLKRDNQGNLGVRSTQGNTEVVINNYSGEKAETRESVDSRGNRRVEVIIGDMTAGEIGRSGSSSQRSIKNTFGLQPQLIRR